MIEGETLGDIDFFDIARERMKEGLQQRLVAKHYGCALGIGGEMVGEPLSDTLHLNALGGSFYHFHRFNVAEIIEVVLREFVGKI